MSVVFFILNRYCLIKWKYNIPPDQITVACGHMDLLTLILIEDIDYGIEYIRADAMLTHENWDAFWTYFNNTLRKKYNTSLWNIHDIPDANLVEGQIIR